LNPKNCYQALGNTCMIRDRIRIFIFYPSRIPEADVKKAPNPGSGTLGEKAEFGFKTS
jgi:hypothetical protein